MAWKKTADDYSWVDGLLRNVRKDERLDESQKQDQAATGVHRSHMCSQRCPTKIRLMALIATSSMTTSVCDQLFFYSMLIVDKEEDVDAITVRSNFDHR